MSSRFAILIYVADFYILYVKESFIVKQTQNRRTINDIARYIKTVNQNGILKRSMMDMAKDTGYSNATVHRSIQQLESEGLIQIIPTKSKRKPNTIIYLGPNIDDVDHLLQKAHTAVYNLHQATSEIDSIMSQIQQSITLLDTTSSEYIHIQ